MTEFNRDKCWITINLVYDNDNQNTLKLQASPHSSGHFLVVIHQIPFFGIRYSASSTKSKIKQIA